MTRSLESAWLAVAVMIIALVVIISLSRVSETTSQLMWKCGELATEAKDASTEEEADAVYQAVYRDCLTADR